MNDVKEEIRVYIPTKGGLVFYYYPSMRLHEDGTRWMAKLNKNGISRTRQKNAAYQTSQFLTYLLTSEIPHQHASKDDLYKYKAVLETFPSDQTGKPLEASSIHQYILSISTFYDDGIKEGWNKTAENFPGDQSQIIDKEAVEMAPPGSLSETDIYPLNPDELNRFLNALGPADKPSRNRLMAEWMYSVGLRISEVVEPDDYKKRGLTTTQILALSPDPNDPYGQCNLTIVGKGNKKRIVVVPNWLILRTHEYIDGERAEAVNHLGKKATNKLFVGDIRSTTYKGTSISPKRVQDIFEEAFIDAGLFKYVEKNLDGKRKILVKEATHSPHDLRHTYAIATYYALVMQGNAEPWKVIQAQLGHSNMKTTIDTYLAFVSINNQWGQDIRRTSVAQLAGLH